jgi:hypothetical protein
LGEVTPTEVITLKSRLETPVITTGIGLP